MQAAEGLRVEGIDLDHLVARIARVVELGINHEQQHQELILTDIKHLFRCNPLLPTYRPLSARTSNVSRSVPARWHDFSGGVVDIGHAAPSFCFDNERPRHKVFLQPFALQDRLITNGEYLEFMLDGGYRRPELWLSLGWTTACNGAWQAPLYWLDSDGHWFEFTLGGLRALVSNDPVWSCSCRSS